MNIPITFNKLGISNDEKEEDIIQLLLVGNTMGNIILFLGETDSSGCDIEYWDCVSIDNPEQVTLLGKEKFINTTSYLSSNKITPMIGDTQCVRIIIKGKLNHIGVNPGKDGILPPSSVFRANIYNIEKIKSNSLTKLDFNGAYNLASIDIEFIPNVTDFQYAFHKCTSLSDIYNLYTSNGVNFEYMFAYCSSLINTPEIDVSNGVNFGSMFMSCSKLISIKYYLNTSNGIIFRNMFSECVSLESLGNIDTMNCTNLNSFCSGCNLLLYIPSLSTSKVTNFEYAFSGCKNLVRVSSIDTTNATNANNMFYSTPKLREIEYLNFPNLISNTAIFVNSSYEEKNLSITFNNLPSISLCNFKVNLLMLDFVLTNILIYNITSVTTSVLIKNQLLNRQACINLFNSLPTVTGKTLNLTGNKDKTTGVLTSTTLTATDKAIATKKGWTLVI